MARARNGIGFVPVRRANAISQHHAVSSVGSLSIMNVLDFLLENSPFFTVLPCAPPLSHPGVRRAPGVPWVPSPKQGSVLLVWLPCSTPQHAWEIGASTSQISGGSGVGGCVCTQVWEVRRTCCCLTAVVQADPVPLLSNGLLWILSGERPTPGSESKPCNQKNLPQIPQMETAEFYMS